MVKDGRSNGRVDKASASGAADSEFHSESRQTNDCKIGIYSLPARHSILKRQCGEQAGKFAWVVRHAICPVVVVAYDFRCPGRVRD